MLHQNPNRTETNIENPLSPPSHINTIFPEDLEDKLSQLKDLVTNYPLEHSERTTYLEAHSRLQISSDFVSMQACHWNVGWRLLYP